MPSMEKKQQLRLILDVVQRQGEISREQSVAMFIPRLPSRIAELKELGFRFQAERRGRDYIYRLVEKPISRRDQAYRS